MASRVLLLIFLFTVGLSVRRSKGLELQFGVEPRDCVVSRHKPALLQCSSPSPNVSFQWTLDNRPLPLVNNSRLQLLNNGTLYFKKVVHKKTGQGASDQGVYRCIIRSPLGALVSQPAHLRFAYMAHDFQEAGRSASAVEGDPALFPCSIDSLPAADFSWEHNLTPLTHSDRYLILDNGTLIIKQVQTDDQGEYRCLAVNIVVNKTRVSEPYTLTVEGRQGATQLEILRPLATRVNWTQGERVSLACVARGTPTPTVKWTKLQQDQSSVLVTNVTESVSILSIDSVTEHHGGVYTCVASQVTGDKKLNTVSITKEVKVEEIFTPPVITKRPKSQEFPTAKTVRFHCEAEGNPTPEIIWFRDGHKLFINGRVKLRKELVLSNTVSNDSGVYQCVASSAAGVAWAAARLTVNVSRGQPRPPSRLLCTTLSSSSVLLSWEQPVPTSLKAFTIHYLPTDGGEEGMAVTEMAHDELNQTYVVDKLFAFTNYTFYVRSYNSNAASENSADVVCRTGESVPRGVPELMAHSQGPTSVLVEWSPLPNSVARGVVSEYKVQWRRQRNPSTHVEFVPGDVTRYLIPGLVPETEYEVRVLAATVKGWPNLPDHEMPWSLVKTSSLTESTPLLPPPSVQLTAINATTVQVRWDFSSASRKVEGFKLLYRKHNSSPSNPVLLDSNSTEYFLHDLEPETWYEVQVKAASGDTEGEIAVRTINTLPLLHNTSTSDSLPTPPTNVEATPTSSAISLTWDPPAAPHNANVTFYTVSYRVVPSGNNSYLQSTSNGVVVSELKPYTLYELKVRTHDKSNRHSEYSQTLECRTLEGVPERVQEVEWKPLNQSSVRVMWKSPEVTHGPLKSYTLSYTQQPSQPLELWQRVALQGTRPAADVTGLTPNVRYFLVIQAATTSGLGSPSEMVELLIPYLKQKPKVNPASSATPPQANDPMLGIALGCAIGGCCVLLCTASLIYRRKCSKPGHGNCQSSTANGTPCFHSHSDHHEMQCLPNHLDSKGGHSNGEVNGLKLPLLSNGRLPNGLVARDRSVRITENPQFECGVTVSCEELRQPSDEGDSLLSGHSLNDTQLTTLTSQLTPGAAHAQLTDKHEPDDGFHESHQPILGPNG